MGQGQGSVTVNQRNVPAGSPGPPFLLTSADNGLSVDPVSGRIVLGQDVGAIGNPGELLSNREIPMNGFVFNFIDNFNNDLLSLNPQSFLSELVATDNTAFSVLALHGDSIGNVVRWGLLADTGAGSDIQLTGDAVTQQIAFTFQGNNFFLLDFASRLYEIGDISGSNNSSLFEIDDNAQTFTMSSTLTGFDVWFLLNVASRLFEIGDVGNNFNNTRIVLDDVNEVITLNSNQPDARFLLISLNAVAGQYQFGDFDNSANGGSLFMGNNQVLQLITQQTGPYLGFFANSGAARQVQMGDIGINGNGNTAIVDDGLSTFFLDNTAHNIAIGINGSTGFTGTLAAAIAGAKNVVSGIIVN